MSDPTYAEASTAQTQTQIRDGLLSALAADGSTVGGLPTSSPDRGMVEADAAQLALEQRMRANVAKAISFDTAIEAGDTWVDAAATWFRVDNGTGGYGRIQATKAVWSVGLKVAPAAAPVTLTTGQTLQVQSTDARHTVFDLALLASLTLNAGSSYKGAGRFVAHAAGAAGNVVASTLQNGSIITSGVAGLDVDASVLPTLSTAGRDQETSRALADRCIASWARLGAAWTRPSFDYLIPLFALTVTGWYVDDANPVGPGSVQVWLRNQAGPATGPEIAAVLAGLTRVDIKPIGSGAVSVLASPTQTLTVTAVLATDGSNSTLVADVEAALAALALALMGPAIVRAEFITAILMGGAFEGQVEVPAGASGATTFPLALPGFRGVASIVSSSYSPSLPLTLSAGELLQLTPVITTQAV